MIGLAILVAASRGAGSSIDQFIREIPNIREKLPELVRPYQEWLASLGYTEVDLEQQANCVLANLERVRRPTRRAGAAAGRCQRRHPRHAAHHVLPVGLDGPRPRPDLAFLFRLVPPAYAEEARVLQTATSRSFGGFLRGQAIMGLVVLPGRPDAAPAVRAAAGGPVGDGRRRPDGDPVLRAVRVVGAAGARRPRVPAGGAAADGPDHGHRLVHRDERPPAANDAGRGRHPPDRGPRLGPDRAKVAGVTGAIFGIPIAAVLSAFFFHFLDRRRRASRRRSRGRPAASRTRGPAGPRPARARARASTPTSRSLEPTPDAGGAATPTAAS